MSIFDWWKKRNRIEIITEPEQLPQQEREEVFPEKEVANKPKVTKSKAAKKKSKSRNRRG